MDFMGFVENPENRPMLIAAVVSGLATLYMFDVGAPMKEITWQDFRVNYLERGIVREMG